MCIHAGAKSWHLCIFAYSHTTLRHSRVSLDRIEQQLAPNFRGESTLIAPEYIFIQYVCACASLVGQNCNIVFNVSLKSRISRLSSKTMRKGDLFCAQLDLCCTMYWKSTLTRIKIHFVVSQDSHPLPRCVHCRGGPREIEHTHRLLCVVMQGLQYHS